MEEVLRGRVPGARAGLTDMEKIIGLHRYLRLPRPIAAQVRQDVEEELRFHLEMRTDELRAMGAAPHQAR